MESVLRALAVYAFLLLVFRIAGKRALAEITTFDFVLLLIVAETTQQALLGEDFSLVNCFLLISTLMCVEILLSLWKRRHPLVDKILDGVPLILLDNGKLLHDRMKRSRVNEDDILVAARELHGIERLDQVKFAVLERSGNFHRSEGTLIKPASDLRSRHRPRPTRRTRRRWRGRQKPGPSPPAGQDGRKWNSRQTSSRPPPASSRE